jgi:WD40 repeat protein
VVRPFGPVKSITLLDAATGRVTRTLAGHTGGTQSLAVSGDGTRYISSGGTGEVKVWEAASGAQLCSIPAREGKIAALALSADGHWAASVHEPPEVTQAIAAFRDFPKIPVSIRVWDAKTGAERCQLAGHRAGVHRLAFSPDGRKLASAGFRVVNIWDLETESVALELDQNEAQSGNSDVLLFSPAGDLLATAGASAAQLWSVASGKSLAVFRGHRSTTIGGLSISPDQSRLATAANREVKLWDARSGQELLTLPLPEAGADAKLDVVALAWSTDGERLRAALRDGSTCEWDGTARRAEPLPQETLE